MSTLLHEAARAGDTDSLNPLLVAGADVNARDAEGRTSLMRAAEAGNDEIIRHLLKYDADIHALTSFGKTALFFAVQKGHPAVISLLLQSGARTDFLVARDPETHLPPEIAEQRKKWAALHQADAEKAGVTKDSPAVEQRLQNFKQEFEKPKHVQWLMVAINSGNAEAVRLLLESGIPPKPDAELTGIGVLGWAIFKGMREIIPDLIAHGADPNAGSGSLFNAVLAGDAEAVRLLLKHGANAEAHSEPMLLALSHGRKDIVDLLLAHGAKIADTPEAGFTFQMARKTPGMEEHIDHTLNTDWHMAIRAGDTLGVAVALDNGAAIDAARGDGTTGLMAAALAGKPEIVHLLLERGPDVHRVANHKDGVLLHAIKGGDLECVRLLLAAGASPTATDRMNFTPLYLAAIRKRRDLFNALVHAGATPTAAEFAFIGDADATFQILASGVPIDAPNEAGATALMGAAHSGNTAFVQELLTRGANPTRGDGVGQTALHHAVSKSNVEVAAILLDAGADPNQGDKFGKTPLNKAVIHRSVPLARLLLERGARIYGASGMRKKIEFPDELEDEPVTREVERESLLHNALWRETEYAKETDPAMFRFLLESGADPNVTDSHDEPLIVTLVRQQTPMPWLEALLEHGVDVDAKDRLRLTALWAALRNKDETRMRRLLEAGADPNAEYDHVHPYDVAEHQQWKHLSDLLAAYGGRPSDKLERFDLADVKTEWILSAANIPSPDENRDSRLYGRATKPRD